MIGVGWTCMLWADVCRVWRDGWGLRLRRCSKLFMDPQDSIHNIGQSSIDIKPEICGRRGGSLAFLTRANLTSFSHSSFLQYQTINTADL